MADDRPRPYEHLWYDDGNIILRTNSHLFRIYRGVLVKESAVFRDMFEQIPLASITGEGTNASDPGAEYEIYEGIPVVPLLHDDESDILNLLKVIFQRQ